MSQSPPPKVELLLGAHSLSSLYEINNFAVLRGVMKSAAQRGAKVFEIPYLLCKLKWESVARAAKEAGIREIALCHFWPVAEGIFVCGNPLGDEAAIEQAMETLDKTSLR